MVTPLDVWSTDPLVALRAARFFAGAPAVAGPELTTTSLSAPRTIHLAAPILLPGHESLAAACLGWAESDVRAVAQGACVSDEGELIAEPDDEPFGTPALRPWLARATTEAASKLRAAGFSPEDLLVDRLPVPILPMDELGPPDRRSQRKALSPLARAFHQLWLVDAGAQRYIELGAPPILLRNSFWLRAGAVETIAATIHQNGIAWSPFDFEAIRQSTQGSVDLSADILRRPQIPAPGGGFGPRQPTAPIAVCFVAGGMLVAYPHALVHIAADGEVVAVVPSCELRINAVSEDGAFVQCVLGGLTSGSFWPVVAVYDVGARAFRDTVPPAPLPTSIVSAVHEMKVLQVYDLEGVRSAPLAVEWLGDTASHVLTTPDGRAAWRRILAKSDTRGLFDIATDRTLWLPPVLVDDSPGTAAESLEDEDEEGHDDFSARAAVVLANGQCRVFCDGRLFEGDTEMFRIAGGSCAAFDRNGQRLALAGRDALRIFTLDEGGRPARQVRFDMHPLRSHLTLDSLYGSGDWDVLEDDVLRTVGSMPALAKVESAEALAAAISESTWRTVEVDTVRGLFDASRNGHEPLPTLTLFETAPQEEGPATPFLQDDALVAPIARWVAEEGTQLRALALRIARSGMPVRDRYVTESEEGAATWAHDGLQEWIFETEHGPFHLLEIPYTDVVVAVAQDARALAPLGPQASIGDDSLRQALLPSAIPLDHPLPGSWEEGNVANAWAMGVAGTEAACSQFVEAAKEFEDVESADVVEALVSKRRKLGTMR